MATRTAIQYAEKSKEPDPKRISDILTTEVARTARQASKVFSRDVAAGSEKASEPDMINAVRANWQTNPQFRSDLLQAQSPDRVVGWVLKAFHPDVTLAQYQKMLESDPTVVPGYDTKPNTGAPPQPKVEPPQPPQPPMPQPMAAPEPPPVIQPPPMAPQPPTGGPF